MDDIEYYRTYLVECYEQVKPPCVLDWPPQEELKYVTPTLFTAKQTFLSQPTDANVQYREIKLADVFSLSKERSKNLTLLLGCPGAGKSTLAWFMSREWAGGRLYQEYRLLVHVSFRDHPKLQSAASLADLIPHPDLESKRSIVQILKQTKGNSVAIIIDGYDEYSNGGTSVVDILLQDIPKASLLVMSRPANIVNRSLIQHSENITSIWLSEFSREQVAEYFSRNSEDVTVINRHFEENIGLLGLCGTPINASIVLFLLHVCELPTRLPSTQTELFELLTINLLIRYWADQRGFEIEAPIKGLKKLPFHWQFKMLCQQTYYAIFGEESIHDMDYDDFLDMPICGISEGLGLVSLRRLPNGIQVMTYLHLLFKDFFAAYYLSTLKTEKQIARVCYLCQHNPESPMLSFLAGFTKLESKELFGVLANFLSDFPQNSTDYEQYCLAKSFNVLDIDPKAPDHRHCLFTLMKCVYESQRPKLCHEIISRVGVNDKCTHVGTVYLSLSYYGIARFAQGCNLVGYFLGVIAATSRGHFRLRISLAGNLLRDSGVQILCEQMVQTYKQLQQPTPANTDIHFYLAANCITHKGVFELSRVVQQIPAITGLDLDYNWSPHIYSFFDDNLPMHVLDIESCLKYLIEGLTYRTSAKGFSISLAGNALSSKHIWHLLLLLMFSKKLTSADLSGNCFGKLSVDFIAVALQHCMLKDLRLNQCGITSLSLLGKKLEFNNTLELLEIRNNPLPQASLIEFFAQLRNNLSLARVWIDEWKDEYGELFTRINTIRFHQSAMLLGCKVGQKAQTYLLRPRISSSLLDSDKFNFQQLFPQSLYGTTQRPGSDVKISTKSI